MSLEAVMKSLPEFPDPFLKSLLYETLWERVQEAELSPVRYIELALASITKESDPMDCAVLLAHIKTALGRYLSPLQHTRWNARVESTLRKIMEDPNTDPTLRLLCYRFFVEIAVTPEGTEYLAALLRRENLWEGCPLASRDRWEMIKRLLQAGHKDAAALFDGESRADQSVDAARYRFEVRAAFPSKSVKAEYFGFYGEEKKYPEAWLEASLKSFNGVGQSSLTLNYLKPALEKVEWLKRHRKIFFLPAWLNAFIQGHTGREALEVVHVFLTEHPELPEDIVLKILQSLDALERTVRIRERFAREDSQYHEK
jgi:aminopeptidase N